MKKLLLILLCFPTLTWAQQTYVPDDNFEQALIDLGYDNSLDDYVLTSTINTITTLNINNKSISDLTGIEDFTALTELNCYHNNLTTINVSSNNALTSLFCYNNQLTTLDVSNNTALTSLFCHNNQLTSLDVRNGTNVNMPSFYAIGNPYLYCIDVDNPAWSTTSWTGVDSWASFAINCSSGAGYTYVPDNNFEQALIDLGYDNFIDDYVLTSNINTVTTLDINGESIADLTGIEDFTSLTELLCQNNQLTALDVTNNSAITNLNCQDNQIISLDLSYNTALTILNCQNNQLTSLDVKNGNNINVISFFSTNNPALYCIEVDNPTWSTTNWTSIDTQSYFSIDCTPACIDPTALAATNIIDISADLNWSTTAGLSNIEYGLTGFILGTGIQIIAITDTTQTITGLTASTAYEYYIQSDCIINESAWVGPFTLVTTPPIPTTQLESISCNTVIGGVTDIIKADAVAGASNYRFRLINGTDTLIVDRPFRSLPLSLVSLSYDLTYNVDVAITLNGIQGNFGPVCTITTPVFPMTQLEAIYCGSTPSSLSSSIKADAATGATGYRFRFRDGVDTMTYDAPFRTVSLSNFALEDGTIYIVDVAVIINAYIGDFGPLCTITTEAFPMTQLETTYCNITVNSLTDNIKADAATGATGYRFRFINGIDTMIYDAPFRTVNLSNFALNFGVTYDVDVAVIVSGVIGSYGPVCTITTPIPTTQLETSFCNISISSLSSSIKAYAATGATGYRFRFINGSDTLIYDAPFRTVNLSNFALNNDLTYNVDVAVIINSITGQFGVVCTIKTPTTITQLSQFYCGSTSNSLVSSIKAIAITGATNYRFRFIYGTDTMTADAPFRTIYLSEFALIANTTYNVDVAVTTGGIMGVYGPVCTITTPGFPITQLASAYCNIVVASLTGSIKANVAAGASTYRFRFINGTDTMTYDSPFRTVSLSNFALVNDQTYNVDVAVIVNGVTGAYGPVCTVTTQPLPTTQLTPTFCGSTSASLVSDIKANSYSGATNYRFRFINGTDTMTYDSPFRTVSLSNFALVNNQTYNVDVAVTLAGSLGLYGPVCTVTTPPFPTTQLTATYCGSTANSLSSSIKAIAAVGATGYRFRFINGTDTMIYDAPFRTVSLSNFALTEITSYFVDVAVIQNGTVGLYGPVCTVTTPPTTTQLETTYCNTTVPTLTSSIKADAFAGASNYRFRFINGTDTMIYDAPFRTVSLSNFALSINLTYYVDVAVTVNGTMNAYGAVCTITTPNSAINIIDKQYNQEESGSLFDTQLYPNPFGNATTLHITSNDLNALVSVFVYDATGRLIEDQSIDLTQQTRIQIGEQYNPGVYYIITSQNDSRKSMRIVKQ